MTSITSADITVVETPVQLVKIRPSSQIVLPITGVKKQSGDDISISLYQPTSGTKFHPRCRHSLLLSSAETSRNPFFHQACVYIPEHEELYITSNLLQSTSSANLPIILISRVKLHRKNSGEVKSVEWQKLRPPASMAMPAGGTAYQDGTVFCCQGNLTDGTGGLYHMPRGKPPEAMVTSFYGRDFNSPHDVVLTKDGSLWFTDPCHGFEKDFRKKPVLPCQVYRYHPETEDLRVMADGLGRPTGITFNPDESTAYVTDSDAFRGNGDQNPGRAATIYAFDVIIRSNSPFLANKRVFAAPMRGIPIGIKCDHNGYVYAGCSDGVEVWNPGGTLQAVIEVPGGVTSFCFGRASEMFVCAETTLWRLQFGSNEDDKGHRSLLDVDRPGWLEWNDQTQLVTALDR